MNTRLLRPLIARNIEAPNAVPRDELVAALANMAPLSVPERIGAWARFFFERGDAEYRFGETPGGYVWEGLLVDDRHTDCVLLTHRAVELAHAETPEDALAEAIARRFPGASPERIVRPDGRVAYTHPARIAYAWELVEAEVLGRNATSLIGPLTDDVSTSRFDAGRVRFAQSDAIRYEALQSGDVLFFVLDERCAGAARVRRDVGAAIGHMGIVRRAPGDAAGDPELIHAASKDLPGVYSGGRIVSVSLRTYVGRVELFKGIVVTRCT